MTNTIFCFGEILWDVLPSGRHAGGAPFNVAAHLAQLRVKSALISAVGRDALGDEMLAVARDKNVDTTHVARSDLPTGTVNAAVDAAGNATYEIVRPVAWDEIAVTDAALAAVASADAIVFGSLAARSSHNVAELDRLLAARGPVKFFDVNLRPPFDDLPLVLTLAKRADVLKLNHDEAALLVAWLEGRPLVPWLATPSVEAVAEACGVIARATGVRRICVTMGAAGAALWDEGVCRHAAAPQVVVRDTVGAGDAFMAGLVLGLTRGAGGQGIVDTAVRLGAFVASHDGATPLLPPEMVAQVTAALTAGA